jgi:hypothetical protein
MDPNLFALDYELTFEVLSVIVLLSLFVERILSVFFELRPYLEWEGALNPEQVDNGRSSIKVLIALIFSIAICWWLDFDALSIIFHRPSMSPAGFAFTGAIIAGGSKGSLTLFTKWMGFRSSALDEAIKLKEKKALLKLNKVVVP